MSIIIDESATINDKAVLVVCLKAAVGESSHPVSFCFDLEHLKLGANAKSIYDGLRSWLQSGRFTMEYLKNLSMN